MMVNHIYFHDLPCCLVPVSCLVFLQASVVSDDQVIFSLTVSFDKLPVNTLKAKVRHAVFRVTSVFSAVPLPALPFVGLSDYHANKCFDIANF